MTFDHSFSEAMEALFHGGKFIQGESFAPGIYAAIDEEGVVVFRDANDYNHNEDLLLTVGLCNQRYRVFSVAHQANNKPAK